MKILLAILFLALISATAFAKPNDNANSRAHEAYAQAQAHKAFAQAQAQAYTIPEPGTFALFAVGIGVLLFKLKK